MKENNLRNEQQTHSFIHQNDCELYKRIVNLNPNAVFLSCDGKFIFANRKALEMIKAENIEDLQSQNTMEIIHPRYRNEVAGRRVSNVCEEFSLDTIEVQLLCKDETVIAVEMESTVFVFGDELLTLTIMKEKVRRIEIDKAYLGRDVLINAILDSAIDGILIVDGEGKIINANNRLIDMWNIPEENFPDLDELSVLKLILSNLEDINQFKNIIERVFSVINEYFDNVRFKDGRVFDFYSCPLIVEGEITGRIWNFRDITKQAEVEEKLKISNFELVDTIGKLKETQAQLIQKEKFAGIGQLAAGVAHEINNPLSFTISNIDTLKKRIFTFESIVEEYRKLADNIVSLSYQDIACEFRLIKELECKSNFSYIIEDMDDLISDSIEGLHRVGRIVTCLRDFSGKYKTDMYEEYNLNDGIESTLTMVESELKYNAEVNRDLGDIPYIKANSGQINQVLLNMLQNSIYAIKMKGEDSLGAVRIKTYVLDKYIVCEIDDNGIGIEEKNIDKIFLPFFTTKDVGEGSGLGLSTAFDIIINKHKGEIAVESTSGKGTRFVIRLPI